MQSDNNNYILAMKVCCVNYFLHKLGIKFWVTFTVRVGSIL